MSKCPHCGEHLENAATRTRRARKARGQCIDCETVLTPEERASAHVRCEECRRIEAAKAQIRRGAKPTSSSTQPV